MSNAALALEGDGLVLNRYRPLRPLGTGGSGSVWLARDEQTGLDVALKIVAREGKAAARAEREAAAAARLRHPSCLRAYAFARDPRHVYIAYEFVPGRTFREALRAGELPRRRGDRGVRPDLRGPRACARGRDPPPRREAVERAARGRRRACRRGCSTSGSRGWPRRRRSTAQGDVPGTLAYISPERLAGEESTAAADVWSIGVMLWESLSGRHPFWQTSMLETARAIEQGAPRLETLRPDLPKRLLELVDRALVGRPRAPPGRARELAQALRGAAAPRRKPQVRAAPREPRRAGAGARAPARRRSPAGSPAGPRPSCPSIPHGWAAGLALAAAAVTAFRAAPRRSRSRSPSPSCRSATSRSASPLLYAALAAGWIVLSWREPRGALLFVLGPLLAPLAALGLVPLLASGLRAGPRRAAQAGLAVLAAGLVAGIRGAPLPFTGAAPPLGLGVAGSGDPFDVAGHARAGGRRPAGAPPRGSRVRGDRRSRCRSRRPAAAGARRRPAPRSSLLCVLAVPSAAAVPLVAAAWVTAVVVALRGGRVA